jgi:hypothetical protein
MTAQPVELREPAPTLRLVPAPLSCPSAAPTEPAPLLSAPPSLPLLPGHDHPAHHTDGAPCRPPVPLAGDDGPCDRIPTSSGELPEPSVWARQFVQAAVEVAVGLRPAVQLARWTEDDVYAVLSRRCDVAARARRAGRPVGQGRSRVRSVRAGEVRDGAVEVCAVVADATRHRAVALRMEGFDGRWRVTALVLG